MCAHFSCHFSLAYWGVERLEEKEKEQRTLLPPLLPFLIVFSLWLDEERKEVWQVCISEHSCLLPKLEGILVSSQSRLLWLAASELSHRHNMLARHPHWISLTSAECPSDALACRMNVKQGSEEQLQMHAVYTRSCSCWSLPTMRLFMLNEVWFFCLFIYF